MKTKKHKTAQKGNYDRKRIPYDLYWQVVEDIGGDVTDAYPVEYVRFTDGQQIQEGDDPPKIAFGSKLGSLTVEFYLAIVPLVETYIALEPYRLDRKTEELKRNAVKFAQQFVKDNRWIVPKFKTMFTDMSKAVLERIAGNVYLLELEQCTTDQIIAWFLIHHATQEVR